MERIRRRWWTWSVSAFAVVVILAALISGLFQLAVLALPDYRDDLSVWVTKVAGRPVQIGGVNLIWRGFSPRLDLSDITLYDEEGEEEMLSAHRLSLGFSLWRLVRVDLTPRNIALSGLTLDVEVDEDGQVSIAGFDAAPDNTRADLNQWLRELERFSSVRLENSVIKLDDERYGFKQARFTVVRLDAEKTLRGFDLDGEVLLPSAYGESIRFDASISGRLAQPQLWAGGFSVLASKLMPQPWLRGHVAPGTRVAAENVNAKLQGELAHGEVSALRFDVKTGALAATRPGQNAAAQSLHLSAGAVREKGGWHARVEQLQIDGDDQLKGELRYTPAPDGYSIKGSAPVIRCGRVAPWLGFARALPPWLRRTADASGEVDDLVFDLHSAGETRHYTAHATLKDVALAPDQTAPGFSGVSGELSADQNGGQFRLGGAAVSLTLPQTFAAPVALEQLAGELRWQLRSDGWQLGMPDLTWKLAGSAGRGRFDLFVPLEIERSPELSLDATFGAPEVTALKFLMPLHWSEQLRGWLSSALISARVPQARLAIHGPLADFPYEDRKTGEWKLDVDVAGAHLAYAPHWPPAENLRAHLHFSGNRLSIASDGAELGGNHVDEVRAEFGDFREERLTIDGRVSGELVRYYWFLQNSPLKETLSGLLASTRAAGPARVAVHLDIPLHDTNRTSASGNVALDGVQLYYSGLTEPVSDLHGDIAFDAAGVSSQKLTAAFADTQLDARIEPRAGTHGAILAQFGFTPNAQGEGLSSYVPQFLRGSLAGTSPWRAEILLGVADAGVKLSSELRGTAVLLPAPLGKSADESAALNLNIAGAGESRLRVHAAYAGRLDAEVALAAAPGGWSARGVGLNIGSGSAAPSAEGINVTSDAPELDLVQWGGALGGMFDAGQGSGLRLRRADLRPGRLVYEGRYLRDTHVLVQPAEHGWTAHLEGAGADGDLNWSDLGSGKLVANFARVEMEGQPVAENDKAGPARAPLDPSAWPALDLSCAACKLDGTELGAMHLLSSRVPGGQQLDHFTIGGGKIEAQASGAWLRQQERSSAQLKFDFTSGNFGALLKSLGYAPNLTARSSKVLGEFEWAPAADGLAWEQARGKLALEFKKGALKAVQPGAGRVLGLLNFYALPRRLTLDFHDVVDSGLSFDGISGTFDFADGNATTSDLKIESPSLRMEMKGRVGLAARDYDEHVTVIPDISSGVTLGAALLGGPALGALAFVAQEVLDKPISEATQLAYRVTGSWDNPDIKRVDSKPGTGDKPGRPVKSAVAPH